MSEPIENLLNLGPFNAQQGVRELHSDIPREVLEHNAVMYTLIHDVLHWLCTNLVVRDQFYSDMTEAFIDQNQEPPTRDLVDSNLVHLHSALELIVRKFEHDFGITPETIQDPGSEV